MSAKIGILYVGETWKGSSARSMRDGLSLLDDVWIDDLGEDHYVPKQHRSKFLRAANRILRPWHLKELDQGIAEKLGTFKPDVLMVYKGGGVSAAVIARAKASGILTVNIFPDYSPHAYGNALSKAMGEYDLVVSTKLFQAEGWTDIYGYRNKCIFVPHGYDPAVHLWSEPSGLQDYDVVLAMSWRQEYQQMVTDLATELAEMPLRIGIAGPGWKEHGHDFPSAWECIGPLHGRAYGEWLRRGKIAIAPLHTRVRINGISQPGDEDTTRTYELAAAHCFFLHRRTPYVQTVYDEQTEVPMWATPLELAQLIRQFLPLEKERREMAAAAHARAVPAYSVPSRAAQVMNGVREALQDRQQSRVGSDTCCA